MMERQPAGAGTVMRDDTVVVALVSRAAKGDQYACNDVIERYAPRLYTICNRYRLSNHDLGDVGLNIWSSACGASLRTRRSRICEEASQMRSDYDDEQLLAALSEAMKARQVVPSRFAETARNAFAWHGIDAELAQLTYDSHNERRVPAAVRSETAPIRAITFTSPRLRVELEITEGSVLGQVIPSRAGILEIHTKAGIRTAEVDEIGCFAVNPIPATPFRLRYRTADGADVLTGWIVL